jgi:hypothetical protein
VRYIVSLCDVTEQAQHLALLADLDRLVGFYSKVKPTHLRPRKRSDRGHRRARNLFARGKLRDRPEGFLTWIEHENKVRWTPSLNAFDFIGHSILEAAFSFSR